MFFFLLLSLPLFSFSSVVYALYRSYDVICLIMSLCLFLCLFLALHLLGFGVSFHTRIKVPLSMHEARYSLQRWETRLDQGGR